MNHSLRDAATSTLRRLGWAWCVVLWLAFAVFAVAVALAQDTDPKPVVVVLASAAGLLAIGFWKPRVIGTAFVLIPVIPFAGFFGAFYAGNTGQYVSLPEVELRMAAYMLLLAIFAHRLPGKPWVRLLWAFGSIAVPGMGLAHFVPWAGIFAAYAFGLAGIFVPSIPFKRLLRRRPAVATAPSCGKAGLSR